MIILLGRGVSLPNAIDGIRLYWGEFNGGQLAGGQLWQAATGQVFYSTGVGFGYFQAYASYNSKNADAMQDSFIICLCNATFEFVAAFAVFGVVGYLGLQPGEEELGSFSLGFLTFPVAIEQMPGAPVWAVLFFLTLMLLGISSSFAMLDAVVTLLCNSSLGRKVSHFKIATGVVIFSFLLSLMYDTEFGYALLTAIDAQVNNIVLLYCLVRVRSHDFVVPHKRCHRPGWTAGLFVIQRRLRWRHDLGTCCSTRRYSRCRCRRRIWHLR